jgi:hypothetical protein
MRRLFAVTLLLVAACAKTPSSPSEPPASPPPGPITFADFSGLWTVQYRVTDCVSHDCYYGLKGSQRTFDLRLQQTGAEVRGLFVERTYYVTEVSGRVSTDGTLVMTGYAPALNSRDSAFRITALTVKRGDTLALQGTVSYESTRPTYGEGTPWPDQVTGDILSANRSDLTAFSENIDGLYVGSFIVRSCTSTSRYCTPYPRDEISEVRLSVTRAGSAVSGTFQDGGRLVSLSGTVSGQAIDMGGEGLTPQSGGSILNRITNWRGTVDAFGRMSGSFHLDTIWPVAAPSVSGSSECELVRVVKVVP